MGNPEMEPKIKPSSPDRYKWTKGNMPFVYETAGRMLAPTNERIAVSLPLTWETLCVVDAVRGKIPNLSVIPQSSGEHSSLEPGVFRHLDRWGVQSYRTALETDRIALLREKPDVIVDCSFVLGETAVRNNLLPKDTVIIEDTKTGENRIEDLGLENPYIILDNSNLKKDYENRIGIGYSVVGALMSMGLYLPRYNVGVIGYGPVGEGVARNLKGLGVDVSVCEVDPERAAIASTKHDVVSKKALLEGSDLVITATGKPNVIDRDDIATLDKVLMLANAGGEDEWRRPELFRGVSLAKIHPHISEAMIGSCRLREIGSGNSVNLAVDVSVSEFLDITFSHLIAVIAQLRNQPLTAGKNDIGKYKVDFLEERLKS